MLSKLNIKVTYSALYRPQVIGLLGRQHRGLKDSLKAAIVEMGQQHQDQWLNHLPFVLLGRRVAYQPDIGASASELVFGTNVRIPEQILYDPGEVQSVESLQQLLKQIREKTSQFGRPTSNHNPPERQLPAVPESATHAYTCQHQTTGLQAP